MASHKRVFSYTENRPVLHITFPATNVTTSLRLSSYKFKVGISICTIPFNRLFITGGKSREPVSIAASKDFAVYTHSPMLNKRSNFSSLSHGGYVYVMGGYLGLRFLKECERYSLEDNRWEAIPDMPEECKTMTAIEAAECVYVFIGINLRMNTHIQKLDLHNLTWQVLSEKLPDLACISPCFKVGDDNSKIFLVIKTGLYAFKPTDNTIELVKRLQAQMTSYYGPSWYCDGVLYTTNSTGPAFRMQIGALS